jgi:hypothetical protein
MLAKRFASTLAAASFLVIGASAVRAAELFSIDNIALNTNLRFRKIDGNPRMSIFTKNNNDPDQQFDRLAGNRGGLLLKQRSTGRCLNAHYLWNGAEINVWPCNANDPDQNWNLLSVSGSRTLIKRTGTNLCVDTPTRNNEGKVHLWTCDSSNPNQRWLSNPVSVGQKFTLSEYFQRLYGHTQAASARQYNPLDNHKAIDSNSRIRPGNVLALVGGEVKTVKNGSVVSNPVNRTTYTCQNNSAASNGTVEIWNPDLQRTFTYLHFATNSIRVKSGSKVNPGDVIGVEGSTGCSTNPHTHVAVNSGAEDPLVTLGNARSRGILDKRYR